MIWNKIYNEIFWTQNGGPVVYGGISAIDMALWDIKGKAFKAPVYKLLGGKNNPRLRTYASQLQFYWGEWSEKGHSWAGMGTPEEFAENALRAVKEGYTALKFDLTQTDEKGVCMGFVRVGGLQSAEVLNRVESRMAAIREAVGPDIDILIENHGQTDTAAALQMAKRLEKYHPFAYEEPSYPSGEITGNIARQTGLPLAHGERLYNRWQFLPMLQSGALQLAQPDLAPAAASPRERRSATWPRPTTAACSCTSAPPTCPSRRRCTWRLPFPISPSTSTTCCSFRRTTRSWCATTTSR